MYLKKFNISNILNLFSLEIQDGTIVYSFKVLKLIVK
jgi:hypothetical protein